MTAKKESVESATKLQFARLYETQDWWLFKTMAESYLEDAVRLKKKDVRAKPIMKLLVRNSRKRLFIGIGVELLLKATYLKLGYLINKPQQQKGGLKLPFTKKECKGISLNKNDTFSLSQLLDVLHKLADVSISKELVNGLKIAKVFRNKEGHVVTEQHDFDADSYKAIESSIVALYAEVFHEALELRFSFLKNEPARWSKKPLQRKLSGRKSHSTESR